MGAENTEAPLAHRAWCVVGPLTVRLRPGSERPPVRRRKKPRVLRGGSSFGPAVLPHDSEVPPRETPDVSRRSAYPDPIARRTGPERLYAAHRTGLTARLVNEARLTPGTSERWISVWEDEAVAWNRRSGAWWEPDRGGTRALVPQPQARVRCECVSSGRGKAAGGSRRGVAHLSARAHRPAVHRRL
jgi:hypothetical protein